MSTEAAGLRFFHRRSQHCAAIDPALELLDLGEPGCSPG
jgi:hypothetical protein